MHPFQAYIGSYCDVNPKDWPKVAACLKPKDFKAGSLLLEEGQICRHVYFLESGFLRFFVWRDGLDKTKFFTSPPYCFTSQRSFTQQTPATENIEVLEDALIWQMYRKDAFRLLDQVPFWNTFVRKLVQEVQYYTEVLYEQIQNETAEQRYKKMVREGDELLQRVPLKHLASYLGIAPQSLSRIRKQIQQDIRS